MVQNNKVLTVSYGTFSCTLEGFDDSFETMKAIAEYFRDLAAEDRYFGSEPPQPDAEMLTRIAQRDSSQRVEARTNETGLLLRASDVTETPEPTKTPEPAIRAAGLNVVNTPEPTPNTPIEPEPFVAEDMPVDDVPPPAADSIAAKLQRIRAVVSHSDVNPNSYSEDEDPSLLGGKAAPVDAVAAAFEAGALTSEDLEPQIPAATQQDVPQTPAADEHAVDAHEPEALFSELEDDADIDVQTDGIVNIMNDVEPASDEISVEEDVSVEQGVLTAEDETELFAEISDIEAELQTRVDSKAENESDLDQDVSRLMAKAGEQMTDPATSSNRETYSHLRTAVAATEAEGETDRANNDQDYRGDLESVVSPRRPEIQVTSMRPASDISAPLKLVAEQRVDDDHTASAPITPRRVTSQQDDTQEESGFAQFAQDQGAQSLPDLLEAAAAYLSFIEGQEQFSRPQLMNKVRSLKQDEFNREESLRSFGQLLRDGKIEKAGGGRFAASNLIGFRPDDERAAG